MNEISERKGPEAIMDRMQEIQSKMDAVFGKTFDKQLTAATAKGLRGAIGGPEAPLNPFGKGLSVCGKATPELKQMISAAAQQNGVDANLLDALVSTESSYDPTARSRTGAMGLCQLMPGTAQSLGVSNPLDPVQNLNGGAKYLSQLLKQFGSTPLALAAYNAGPGAVLRAGNQVPPYHETRNYVNKIMSLVNARSEP